MVLINSHRINNANKKGYFCMSECFGQFVFGQIVRVTNSKRIIVQSELREHTLPKSCDILIFSESKFGYDKIDNTWTLRHYFPNFFIDAEKKCVEMGVSLKEVFCVSKEFEPKRPTFSTYQLAKTEYRKLRQNGAENLIIHNGLKIYYPKNITPSVSA